MQAIGIDIGTTSICGILIDTENDRIIHTVNKANTASLSSKLAYEKIQSPDIISETVREIMDELYAASDDLCAIGVTGQMHGILYTDAEGKAVSPLYTWQDERGNLLYEGNISYAQHLNSHTGYGNVTNFYNRENGLIPKESRHFCTIHDYIVMKLTGRKEPLIHISDAASFGLFDMERKCFTAHDPLLPEFTEKAVNAGTWKGIPVCVAIGDNQASFIGCGCSEGSVLVNMGTGSQVSFISDLREPFKGMELRPLYDDKYIMVGSSLCGGRAYAALNNFFKEVVKMSGSTCEGLYEKMQKAGEAHSGALPVFETLFCGTRDDESRRAAIKELSLDNFTPGNLVYSCLCGMASELYELYAQYGGCGSLIGSGNGIRKNPLLKSIVEDVFGMSMHIPEYSEEASYGAAMFALRAQGKIF